MAAGAWSVCARHGASRPVALAWATRRHLAHPRRVLGRVLCSQVPSTSHSAVHCPEAALLAALPWSSRQPWASRSDAAHFRVYYNAFADAFIHTANWHPESLPIEQRAGWRDFHRSLCGITQSGMTVAFRSHMDRANYTSYHVRSRSGYLAHLLAVTPERNETIGEVAMGALRKSLLEGCSEELQVVSVGGGPGFDVIGLWAFFTYIAAAGLAEVPRLSVLVADSDPGWYPLLSAVGPTLAHLAGILAQAGISAPSLGVEQAPCDVRFGLGAGENRRLAAAASSPALVLCSFVLSEHVHALRNSGFAFLTDFLVRSPRAMLLTDSSNRLWPDVESAARACTGGACASAKALRQRPQTGLPRNALLLLPGKMPRAGVV